MSEAKPENKPIYQVTNFTDLSREILQFEPVGIPLAGATPEKKFYQGRATVRLNQKGPPMNVFFDFKTEQSVAECFQHFNQKLMETIKQIQKDQANKGPVVPATAMPSLPKKK
jgi:hypothetical protein